VAIQTEAVVSFKVRTIRSVFKIHILHVLCITSLFKKFEKKTHLLGFIQTHARAQARL